MDDKFLQLLLSSLLFICLIIIIACVILYIIIEYKNEKQCKKLKTLKYDLDKQEREIKEYSKNVDEKERFLALREKENFCKADIQPGMVVFLRDGTGAPVIDEKRFLFSNGSMLLSDYNEDLTYKDSKENEYVAIDKVCGIQPWVYASSSGININEDRFFYTIWKRKC